MAAGDADGFVPQRAVYALDETVGARRRDFAGSVLDACPGERQLVRTLLRVSAELAAVADQDGADLDAKGLIEGQHTVDQGIGGSDRILTSIDLGEGQRAASVDHDLDVDLAHPIGRASVESGSFQELTAGLRLDVLGRVSLPAFSCSRRCSSLSN